MWLDTAIPLDLDLGLAMGISSLAQRGVRCESPNQCLLQTVTGRSSGAAINLALAQDVTRDQTNLSDRRQISEWVMVRLCRSKASGLPEVDADRSPRGTREAPTPGGNGARMNSLIFPSPLDPPPDNNQMKSVRGGQVGAPVITAIHKSSNTSPLFIYLFIFVSENYSEASTPAMAEYISFTRLQRWSNYGTGLWNVIWTNFVVSCRLSVIFVQYQCLVIIIIMIKKSPLSQMSSLSDIVSIWPAHYDLVTG